MISVSVNLPCEQEFISQVHIWYSLLYMVWCDNLLIYLLRFDCIITRKSGLFRARILLVWKSMDVEAVLIETTYIKVARPHWDWPKTQCSYIIESISQAMQSALSYKFIRYLVPLEGGSKMLALYSLFQRKSVFSTFTVLRWPVM